MLFFLADLETVVRVHASMAEDYLSTNKLGLTFIKVTAIIFGRESQALQISYNNV
jgi:hypothetical protein